MKAAVFTISSNNYYAQAKVLMNSLGEAYPDWDRYFILVDEINAEIWEEDTAFTKIHFSQLGNANFQKMTFVYDVLELNTAVKPFAIWYFLKEKGYDRVIYLDPDIYVYRGMDEVEQSFNNGANIIITPHLTKPLIEDGYEPNEMGMLHTGIYNLGFIAVNNSVESQKAIKWWADRCYELCMDDPDKGLYVDQKWVNYFPSQYEGVHILKNPGYNVAYWNVSQRKIELKDNNYYINGNPLVFFHFSGTNIEDKHCFSRHCTRPLGNNEEIVLRLAALYKEKVLDAGYLNYKDIQYAYGVFTDGRPITRRHRTFFREHKELAEEIGQTPFDKGYIFYDENSILLRYYDWYAQEKRKGMLARIYSSESIVIFGVGANGQKLYSLLKEKGRDKSVKCFCDNSTNKNMDIFAEIYTPEEAVLKYEDSLYLITPENYQIEIIGQLLGLGIRPDNIMIFSVFEIYEILASEIVWRDYALSYRQGIQTKDP